MTTATQTEMHPPRHAATMPPPSPPSHKKPNFFKRHLPHRRTSVQIPTLVPHEQSDSAPSPDVHPDAHHEYAVQPTPAEKHDAPVVSEAPRTATDSTLASSGDNADPNSKNAKVKWIEGFDEPLPPRQRRTSSVGTNARRSSIYSRAAEGHYLEGVETGVGSKARKLSKQIPDALEVDECALEDHFSFMSRFQQKDIGEGGAAVVRLMKSKTAGTGKDRVFAVKEFRARDPEEEDETDYERKIKSEYAIAKSCQHPNIVETFRLCTMDHRWWHVMEYCEWGDLNDLINKNYFSREDRNCMFKQLIRGIDYLHSRGIAHRDIKSENLLVSRQGCLKIADFGTGEVFCGQHPGVRGCRRASIIDPEDEIRYCVPGLVGSRPYMAPEILKKKGDYDPRAVDVWSAAIVYLTLCFGGTPWEAATADINNFNIYCTTWDRWLEKYPDGEINKNRSLPEFVNTRQFQRLDDLGTKRLIFGMLHPDPRKRWTSAQVLACTTVVQYECCQQEGYSDDLRTRQRKALHNHEPPKESKRFLKPH